MFNITKIPVVILSSKRTGSTPLTYDIWDQLKTIDKDIELFIEPNESGSMMKLITAIENKKNYILKIHAGDLWRYPTIVQDIVNTHDCFLIRIRRKNLIEQLTSLYIADQRNIWHYDSKTNYNQISNDIDTDRINHLIKFLDRYNNKLDNYPVTFDLDLYYEDLNFYNTYALKTPLPENYELISKKIEERLLCQKEY